MSKHSLAIDILVQQLENKFGTNRIFREQTIIDGLHLLPDIAIQLDHGMNKWIVIEVGQTSASKLKLYRETQGIKEVWWYDVDSLVIVGKWEFDNPLQKVLFVDPKVKKMNELRTMDEKIKELGMMIDRMLAQLEELDRDVEVRSAFHDHRARFLCPACLYPTVILDAKRLDLGYGNSILICGSCYLTKKLPKYEIHTKGGPHLARQLFQAFEDTVKSKELYYKIMSYGDLKKLMVKGIEGIEMDK